jgi:hypothetical protein
MTNNPRRAPRHRLALIAAVPFVAAAGLLAGASQPVTIRTPGSQPIPTRPTGPQPERRPIDGPQYAAWIPPGTYSAIILNSSGDERRWAVSLMYGKTNVPIVVPPRDNIVIEFKDGWTVSPSDEARLVSNLVPFDDSALYNKVGEQPKYVLSAWGITARGPVQFVYREIRD